MRAALLILGMLPACYIGGGGHGGGIVHASRPVTTARGTSSTPQLTGDGGDISAGFVLQPNPTQLVAAGVLVQSAAGEAAGGFMVRGEQAFDAHRPWLRAYTQISETGHHCPDGHPMDCIGRSDDLGVTTVSVGVATTAQDGHHAGGAGLGAMYMHVHDSQFGSADAIGLQLSTFMTVHPMEMLWSLYKHPPRGTQ
jgi:hypothetical protein